MAKFGISLDEELVDWIEAYRVREDESGNTRIVSRSQAVRELVRLGRIATEELEETRDVDLPPGRPREAWLRQSVIDALDREGEE